MRNVNLFAMIAVYLLTASLVVGVWNCSDTNKSNAPNETQGMTSTYVYGGKVPPEVIIKAHYRVRVNEAEQVMKQRGLYEKAWHKALKEAEKTGRFELEMPLGLMYEIGSFKYTMQLQGKKADMKLIDQNIGGVQMISCTGTKSCLLDCGTYQKVRITGIPNACVCTNQQGNCIGINCGDSPCTSLDICCAN